VVFDERRGPRPVGSSPVERSHHDPVHRVLFLNSKAGTDAFSASTDGQAMWWDVQKLADPLEVVPLAFDGTHGATTLEYEPTMPTKFMVGCEDGVVLGGNRKGKTPADKIATLYAAHHGPIYALQRNPFNSKYFMTVGDWSIRIWSEDIRESPIMATKFACCLFSVYFFFNPLTRDHGMVYTGTTRRRSRAVCGAQFALVSFTLVALTVPWMCGT
jgi:dynein intermediate chain 2